MRPVTGGRAETARDWVEAARGRCDPQALEGLWAAVPEAMRLSRFDESSVPPRYAGAFCRDGTWQVRGGPVEPARADAPGAGLVRVRRSSSWAGRSRHRS